MAACIEALALLPLAAWFLNWCAATALTAAGAALWTLARRLSRGAA